MNASQKFSAHEACDQVVASPVQVIYVGGYGRSGSTLVDMAIGSVPGVFGAGEIGGLVRHAWPNREYCACGATVPECEVWSEIVRAWLNDEPEGTMTKYHRLCERMESLTNPLGYLGPKWMPIGFSEYSRLTLKLFEAIRQTTGCRVIVDSSKSPSRAMALSRVSGLDLSLVHLVRDVRGVAWSMMRTHAVDPQAGVQREVGGKPALRTANRWIAFNAMTEYVGKRLGDGRFTRITYESFVANPGAALQSIGALPSAIGVDFSSECVNTAKSHHQVAGSRIRMLGEVDFLKDDKWVQQMPDADQQAVIKRAAKWMHRYGYM